MMISVLKRMSLLVLLAGPLAFLSGCNTMEGLGQDTQELGESIEGEAQEHD
ncbi:entericidin A/B family lipoprotein [Guyparkeria hydrothermalis]|nr:MULTISPECIES: entericidin A/B family lipoprotein [Guyparkeria]MCL7751461.1 entericidin A/B family lipoprotein [Guyparkeria hydrothermalis]